MLGWLVFRMGVATIRNLIALKCGDWNVKLHFSAHYITFCLMNHTLKIRQSRFFNEHRGTNKTAGCFS
jgi:hypothetical protein